MTDILIRCFLKHRRDRDTSAVRASYGALAGITGIICNIMLFALKLIAGLAAGSVSVIADAVNNISDASSGVVSLAGFKLSGRPADFEHPYGHGRYEYLAGLILAFMIVAAGGELLRESVRKIINPGDIYFGALSIIILICSIAVKLWMMMFYGKIGNIISSKTLLTAAVDSRNDVISTSAVLLGAIFSRITEVNTDGWIGLAVALFIIINGFIMVKETLDPVIGRAPDNETIEKIRSRIMEYDGVLGTHDLMVHDYGPGKQFASVHVEMSAEQDVIAGHDIIDTIERDFLNKDGIHMIIHLDPVPPGNSVLGNLREWIVSEVRMLDERVSIHDLKMIDTEKKIVLDCVIPEDMEIGDKEVNKFLNNITKVKYPDHTCEVTIDRSYCCIAGSNS